MTLAPNFDGLLGKRITEEISRCIADWQMQEVTGEKRFAAYPTKMDQHFFMDLERILLLRRAPLDKDTYQTALARVTAATEDKFLSFRMFSMLKYTGINERAHLYQHALSRAYIDNHPKLAE